MALEINLVPDIKNEMIKTLKLRNFIVLRCLVVASASVAVCLIFGTIVGGQQLAIDSKTEVLKTYSTTLNSYSDLNEFLTIKDQVGNIASITENKNVISRTFNILSALIPQDGPDEIWISELNINLSEANPTFTFEAQANAGQAPYFDYRVLDSFKKSMEYMRYDYGNYVDKDNNIIPAYCMIEKNSDGAYFNDPTNGLYAYWTVFAEGCNTLDDASTESSATIAGYNIEDYNGSRVIKVWRTPQASWYNPRAGNNEPQMTENGEISNVAHFKSECINYQLIIKDNAVAKIDDTDNSCRLVPGETEEDRISSESSNGRDAEGELVLRFSAVITLAPEVYDFNNFHMIALAPSKRRNVTDSYVQLQSIFGERAKACEEGDTDCRTNTNGGN